MPKKLGPKSVIALKLRRSSFAVSAYLASIGSEGGKSTGKAKSRGNSEHYRQLSQKAAAARKRKAKAQASHLTESDKPAPSNPVESARKQLTKRKP